jgi:anti-sigma factor (TIGR02949 family)
MAASECRELEPLLQPYVDGEFDADDKVELEVHLAHCAACRLRVDEERRLRARLVAVSQVAAPAALRSRIAVGLKQERRWTTVHTSLRAAAVAAVAACAGFMGYVEIQKMLEPQFDDAVDRHSKNLPVEVSGDEQRVQRWFEGKVDFNVHVPHLQNVNLQGGRLSHIGDHSAAYMVYGGPNARRVSLFVFDDPRAPIEMGLNRKRTRIADRDVILGNARGYNVAVWREKEIVYSLVSDLDEHDLVGMLENRAVVSEPVVPPALNDPPDGMNQIFPVGLRARP